MTLRRLHCVLLPLLALAAADAAAQRGGRIAPPSTLDCERNQLTSFEGRLLRLDAEPGRHRVVLLTDWDSTETFLVPDGAEGPAWLVNGEPAPPAQWRALIPDGTQPPPGLRLIAWVCACPESVTIDWRPAPE